jgi:hypothetical protein
VVSKASQPQQVSHNHHYVSAGYLAQFTDKGTKKGLLCVLDFSEKKFDRKKPKEVASEVDYNLVESPNLTPDAYETAQGRFEGEAIRRIREICKSGMMLDEHSFSYIHNLIMLFIIKNPALRNARTRMQDTIYRQAMKLNTANQRIYEQSVDRAKKNGFISPHLNTPYEKAKDFVERGEFTIHIPSHSHVVTEMSAFNELLPFVAERYWSVMNVAIGAPDLITCDRPAPPQVNVDPIIFTISPRRALMGITSFRPPNEFEIDIGQVARINTDLLEQANNQIYSRNENITLLKENKIGIFDMRQIFPAQAGT